jgi:hypothetical protein
LTNSKKPQAAKTLPQSKLEKISPLTYLCARNHRQEGPTGKTAAFQPFTNLSLRTP